MHTQKISSSALYDVICDEQYALLISIYKEVARFVGQEHCVEAEGLKSIAASCGEEHQIV